MDKIKRTGEPYKPYNETINRCTIDISNDAVKLLLDAISLYKERFGDQDDPRERQALDEIHTHLLKVFDDLNPS